jgi:hypothetical protein
VDERPPARNRRRLPVQHRARMTSTPTTPPTLRRKPGIASPRR